MSELGAGDFADQLIARNTPKKQSDDDARADINGDGTVYRWPPDYGVERPEPPRILEALLKKDAEEKVQRFEAPAEPLLRVKLGGKGSPGSAAGAPKPQSRNPLLHIPLPRVKE